MSGISKNRPVVATTFYVRYAETDQMGIVHHSAYLVWFEEGRSQYMRACGADYADIERSGALFAVTEAHARYEAPARYGDRVTVRTWVEEVRSRAITFRYAVYNADTGERLATGWTRHVCLDRNGRVTVIPEIWRSMLARGPQSASFGDQRVQVEEVR
ncbi:acyl-CoA thioesterase [Thermoflexus sp.]|uniref:acyl-CoA thioesterase n=1 Tax=Thermoflexus sp. TaxID=1969742 RepID=UPI0035E43574